MADFSRRQFMMTAGAAAAGTVLVHGCTPGANNTGSNSTPAVNVNPADAPEVTKARIGFIAVISGAPLIIAKEKGFYEKYGMKDVEVVKQASWGTDRDNLVLGSQGGGLDGAHVLFPMAYQISTGEINNNKQKVPMYILARLNLNGQGISLANTYKDLKVGTDSSALKAAFAKTKAAGKEIKCSVPFPRSTGDFFMRWWLANGGIEPDKDVSIIVVPPAQAVANLKVGNVEAFSGVEPWHQQLVQQGSGYTAVTTGELWNNHPEKAFTMRADWVDKYPKAAKALLMAVQEAQIWCDKLENKEEMCTILSKRQWYNIPVKDMLDRAKGRFDYGTGRVVENSQHLIKYWSDNASYPYKSHDLWCLYEDMRWGFRSPNTDKTELTKLVDSVNREDLWKAAASAIGQQAAIPASTSRGVEKFFNGYEFDPENPEAYLKYPKVKKV